MREPTQLGFERIATFLHVMFWSLLSGLRSIEVESYYDAPEALINSLGNGWSVQMLPVVDTRIGAPDSEYNVLSDRGRCPISPPTKTTR